jgi:hypothetical protein
MPSIHRKENAYGDSFNTAGAIGLPPPHDKCAREVIILRTSSFTPNVKKTFDRFSQVAVPAITPVP